MEPNTITVIALVIATLCAFAAAFSRYRATSVNPPPYFARLHWGWLGMAVWFLAQLLTLVLKH